MSSQLYTLSHGFPTTSHDFPPGREALPLETALLPQEQNSPRYAWSLKPLVWPQAPAPGANGRGKGCRTPLREGHMHTRAFSPLGT